MMAIAMQKILLSSIGSTERGYETFPNADMTPREAYERLVAGDMELFRWTSSQHRCERIPMLMSGENFGAPNSPQIAYLRGTQNREQQFPGFAPSSKAQS